jgi:predicted RNase H-like nuclease (RuvC/YqgF family)
LRKSQNILDKKEARIEELQKQLNEAMQTRGELKKELDATKTKCLIAEKQAKYAEEELRRKMGTATVTAPATATTAARGK